MKATERGYSYTLRALNIADSGGQATPDVRIDDADFMVRAIKVRAQLAESTGTAIVGTPLVRTPSTATNTTMPSSGTCLARININDQWSHDKPVPIDMLGAYAPGDDPILAKPFVIPARAKVYAEIVNNNVAANIDVFITFEGEKLAAA